jgi:hypothetical protein
MYWFHNDIYDTYIISLLNLSVYSFIVEKKIGKFYAAILVFDKIDFVIYFM